MDLDELKRRLGDFEENEDGSFTIKPKHPLNWIGVTIKLPEE